MKLFAFVAFFALAVALIAAAKASTGAPKQRTRGKPLAKPRKPLTDRERQMFHRLKEALPDHHVFAQVAFSALLDTTDRAVRNTFDRKVADFVVCTAELDVLATVELDDETHRNRQVHDRFRDALLTDAGYHVLRYRHFPTADRLKADIASIEAPEHFAPTTPAPEAPRANEPSL